MAAFIAGVAKKFNYDPVLVREYLNDYLSDLRCDLYVMLQLLICLFILYLSPGAALLPH